MMNRRFRAGELGLAEVERNLAPFRPHVETSPVGVSLRASSGENTSAQGIGADRSEAPSGGPSSTQGIEVKEAPFEEAASSERIDLLRRDALEALHNYVVAATGYRLPRSMTIFNRVIRTLDNQLAPASERGRPNQ